MSRLHKGRAHHYFRRRVLMTTMDVRCPQCDTLYEIDAHQLRGGSNTLKCSQCEHIFKMQTHASMVQENQRRWMVKGVETGDIRYFMGFDELHQWILSGLVSKIDEISRTGRRWRRLGEVGEFMPIFQAAESIATLSQAKAGGPGPAQFSTSESRVSTPENPASQQSSARSSGPQRSVEQPVQQQAAQQQAVQQPAHRPSHASSPQIRPRQGSASNPAPPQQPRQRRHTSQQFGGTQPLPPSPRERLASRSSESGAASSTPKRTGTAPGVRLQSGAFGQAPGRGGRGYTPQPGTPAAIFNQAADAGPSAGGPTGPADDDDGWSLGDLPLGVAEGHGREASGLWRRDSGAFVAADPHQLDSLSGPSEISGSYTQSIARPRPFKRVLVGVLLVLLLGGGALATLYFARPALFTQITGVEVGEAGTASKSTGGGASSADEALQAAGAQVQDAAADALAAAQTRGDQESLAAIGAARPITERAVATGLTAAQKAKPREPSLNELLASANKALTAGNASRARKDFHRAISKDRTNVEAITGLGWALLAMGNPSAAAAQFNKANAFNPDFGDAYIGLGTARRDMGETAAALKSFETYIQKFPSGSKASIARYQIQNLKGALGE